jgi:hypothetical protein
MHCRHRIFGSAGVIRRIGRVAYLSARARDGRLVAVFDMGLFVMLRIYSSQEDPALFVLIAEPMNPESLPDHVRLILGPLVPFKRIVLDADSRIGLGFYICRVSILFEKGYCEMTG